MKPHLHNNIGRLTLGILLLILTPLIVRCASEPAKTYNKDGKTYGVTQGNWRGKWSNYYERGLSFAAGEYWTEAASDFNQAIKLRSTDQLRARTYGLHFIDDYFPHRELGFTYLNMKNFDDAIRELEDSNSMQPSARARHYLDQARAEKLQMTNEDKQAPTVKIDAPLQGAATNAFEVTINGHATDDFYVGAITVNGEPVQIDLSAPELPFEHKVKVARGANDITVSATDLTGKTTEKNVSIYVDRQGPSVGLDSPSREDIIEGQIVRVEGVLVDETGIESLTVAGKTITLSGANAIEKTFIANIPADPTSDSLIFVARDTAGNTTRGEIQFSRPTTVFNHFNSQPLATSLCSSRI
ncbi:hypothetical protein ACFL1X_08930 [Candidatus Hydrogenedentota bacterium]